MQRTVTIAANSQYTERVKGKVCGLISASAPIDIEADQEGRQTFVPGRKISGQAFKRLTFFETSGADNTIIFYAGDDDIVLTSPTSTDGVSTNVNTSGGDTTVTPTEGIKVLTADNTPTQLSTSATITFKQILIYPAKAVASGILTPNGADIYIGRSATYQPDQRAATDVAYPVVYECPQGQRMLLSKIRIQGTTGDGAFYSYT